MELDVRRSIRQQLGVLRSAGVQQLPLGCNPVAPTADTLETHAPTVGPVDESLQTLCDQVSACQKCTELVTSRSRTVFGVGNPRARLCFFGEGPGAEEDRLGEPFVGAAGQLLNRIIQACTLTREEVYILNTVKCRPPGNRNPTAVEVEHCRPFFEQQLKLIQPEFICCLGGVAAKALLPNTTSVGKMRLRLHEWRDAKVVVTYHPAYVLREPKAKRQVWDDMKFLMSQMGVKL